MGAMERPTSLARTDLVSADVASSFEVLFDAHHERLYRAIYLIVGNGHEAEELMQDAFLRVLERWDPTVANNGSSGPWIRPAS
jgi:DNA-directed RNA polymerase specialized sigma24 family protein